MRIGDCGKRLRFYFYDVPQKQFVASIMDCEGQQAGRSVHYPSQKVRYQFH